MNNNSEQITISLPYNKHHFKYSDQDKSELIIKMNKYQSDLKYSTNKHNKNLKELSSRKKKYSNIHMEDLSKEKKLEIASKINNEISDNNNDNIIKYSEMCINSDKLRRYLYDFELDNYTPFDKMDVYSIILSSVQSSNLYRWTELKEVLNGIHPSNCWKYGYYTNANCDWIKESHTYSEYDMPTAFIYYTLSNLRFIDKTQWNPQMPKITKYPKSKDITINKLFVHFCKNISN